MTIFFFISVIVYLILFRLEELGIQHFAKFVNSQNKAKMHKVRLFTLMAVLLKILKFMNSLSICFSRPDSFVKIHSLDIFLKKFHTDLFKVFVMVLLRFFPTHWTFNRSFLEKNKFKLKNPDLQLVCSQIFYLFIISSLIFQKVQC